MVVEYFLSVSIKAASREKVLDVNWREILLL